jgi:hypothetical protein
VEPTRFVLPSLHPPKIGFTIGKQRLSRSLGLAVDFLLPPAANFVTGRALQRPSKPFQLGTLHVYKYLRKAGHIR